MLRLRQTTGRAYPRRYLLDPSESALWDLRSYAVLIIAQQQTRCNSKFVFERRLLLRRILNWRLAKVIPKQYAHRDCDAVAHRRKEVHLPHGVNDGLVQAITGPPHNFDPLDFAARIDV